eukprot:1151431-Pelagomonas_calceolata.AAC.5
MKIVTAVKTIPTSIRKKSRGHLGLTVYPSAKRRSPLSLVKLQGLQGVGLQPENLAGRLLVKHYHPASKIETSSDNNFENLCES